MTVRIVTDSAADLPGSVVEKHRITVLPMVILDGEKEYLDGKTLDSVHLLNEMRGGKVFKTAQVPIHLFEQTFAEAAAQGESVVYIAVSSGLSGTYSSSVLVKRELAERFPSLDVTIVDSGCASVGLGLVVLFAARMAAAGRSKEEIVDAVQFYAAHMEHIFTVDDLEYLYRGGRVSRSAAWIGGMLNIKPLMHMVGGKLVPFEKIRGRRKVLERMVEVMGERGADLSEQEIAISHGDDPETAEALRATIAQRFGCRDIAVHTLGGVIGAHAGPGTLAVFFLNQVRQSGSVSPPA